jgi:hypothetical protein
MRLAQESTPVGWSRRRRAVAALMAAGWSEKRYDSEVEQLGARPSVIRKKLEGAFVPADSQVDFERVEQAVSALDDSTVFGERVVPSAKCWQQEPGNYVGWSNNQRTLIIGAAVSVAPLVQSLQKVKESIDPQRWDDCSGFWPADGTYLIKRTAPPWLGPGEKDPAPLPNPPNNGALWDDPLFLFETYECTKGCDAHFRTILGTLVEDRLGRHTVGFKLAPEGGLSGDISKGVVHPSIDQGKIEAWADTSAIYVVARKELEFEEDWANSVAYTALLNYEKARALGELACCLNQMTLSKGSTDEETCERQAGTSR